MNGLMISICMQIAATLSDCSSEGLKMFFWKPFSTLSISCLVAEFESEKANSADAK